MIKQRSINQSQSINRKVRVIRQSSKKLVLQTPYRGRYVYKPNAHWYGINHFYEIVTINWNIITKKIIIYSIL